MDASSTHPGTFELGIWHPLALPADKQDRAGYKTLQGPSRSYQSTVSRSERRQAINAVRAFVDEAADFIAALPEGESDLTSASGPLHIIIRLNPDAGIRIVSAIAESAHRHGLVFYDPQADILAVPPQRIFSEAENSFGSTEEAISNNEEATIITVGPWTVKAFVATTKRYYEKITESGSDRCGCENCSNFAQLRDQAYPPEMLSVFDSLGINFSRESEVHYYGRTSAELHTYRGWFYFAGLMESGPDSWYHPPEGKPEKRFYRIGPRFEMGLKKKADYGFSEWETVLIDAGFADGPTVEIDFYTDLPWISKAPEPRG
ncbi:MAG TPA: hypothetical protein VEU96_10115 [Bryobacteraceae bacterium]|nr:hypothetical protein [Bryobacteraceae bacterium]